MQVRILVVVLHIAILTYMYNTSVPLKAVDKKTLSKKKVLCKIGSYRSENGPYEYSYKYKLICKKEAP